MPAKQGLDQHNILHQHFPGDCCLCRTEQNILDLQRDNRILRKALENLARKVVDEITESSVHTLIERMIEDAKDE